MCLRWHVLSLGGEYLESGQTSPSNLSPNLDRLKYIMCPMARLRYFDDNDVLQTRALDKDKFIIGRVESCNICLVDDLVSREHARVDCDPDGRYRIRDLGARNKTFVNAQQISETMLADGDVIRIGKRVFEFIDDSFQAERLDLSFLTPDDSDPAGTEWIKAKEPVTLSLESQAQLALLRSDVGYPAKSEDVANAALGRLVLSLEAERGFIAIRGDSKKELRPMAHRALRRLASGALMPVSQTFVYGGFLQGVAGRYPQSAKELSPKTGFAMTAMVAPLRHQGQTIGIVYVDRPVSKQPFSITALHEFAAAGAHIGALMADASRQWTEASVGDAAAWLAALRRMQLAMTVPSEGNDAFDVAVKLFAGHSRCGDFCDVVHVGDDRTVVITVDGGGHGVMGLAQANAMRVALRTALTVEDTMQDLATIMSALNRTFTARRARQLVTCNVVMLDLSKGRADYVNAGGPAPLLLPGQGHLIVLDQPSLVLGVDPHYEYECASADLPAAFRLISHTDGLTEMTNAAGEPFGEQRLHDLFLQAEAFGTPPEIIVRIVEAHEKHAGGRPSDDDALVVVVGHG